MTSHNVMFIDVNGALYHVALNQNRNAVFICSVDACFIFAEQINIFMQPLYKAFILYYKIKYSYCIPRKNPS